MEHAAARRPGHNIATPYCGIDERGGGGAVQSEHGVRLVELGAGYLRGRQDTACFAPKGGSS